MNKKHHDPDYAVYGDRLPRTVRTWRIVRMVAASRYMTVEKLSEELGFNKKTIYRDIKALEIAGFPIYYSRVDHAQYVRLDKDWLLGEPGPAAEGARP